ncbi:hypothetical protein vBValSX1_86 [Vibrio phage vB_ValS_X1]|uniref:Uncharacterized protein n=1 Tax=Vibrio phage vB_ValS_X1 TaxID=2736341 RepID=A0A6M9Z7Z8_9CAUD|nr:hypothetical protein vBValSX1_86 [Vibrio phage vB_ValS_X1]
MANKHLLTGDLPLEVRKLVIKNPSLIEGQHRELLKSLLGFRTNSEYAGWLATLPKPKKEEKPDD